MSEQRQQRAGESGAQAGGVKPLAVSTCRAAREAADEALEATADWAGKDAAGLRAGGVQPLVASRYGAAREAGYEGTRAVANRSGKKAA